VHVYVCILCVCLRRPKPLVCTQRERANHLRAEREKQSRLMNDPLLVGGCEPCPLQHPIEHVSRRPRKDICHHLSFLYVCVCCVLCLERVADAPSSSPPFSSLIERRKKGYRTIRLILSFLFFFGSPFIFSYFLFQYTMDRRGMLIRPSSAYLHPCVMPCGYKQMESRKIKRIR
jgi:hypothetical protein